MHQPGIAQQCFDLELGAVDAGSASFARALLLVRRIGDRIGLHPGDQVIVLIEQAVDDFARRVVRIGHEVERILDCDDAQQGKHLVEQGTPIAIGPHQPLVDAHGQRYREDTLSGLYQHADSLERVTHDVFGLGVRIRVLMQQLHAGHLLAALGHLDAVAHQHPPAIDAQRLRE